MRGARSKALRREHADQPHPQRKHGGTVGLQNELSRIRAHNAKVLRQSLRGRGVLIDDPSPTKETS